MPGSVLVVLFDLFVEKNRKRSFDLERTYLKNFTRPPSASLLKAPGLGKGRTLEPGELAVIVG